MTLEVILEQIALHLGVSQNAYSSHFVDQYNRRHMEPILEASRSREVSEKSLRVSRLALLVAVAAAVAAFLSAFLK